MDEEQDRKPATFTGRIQLEAFKYTSPEPSTLRRNPPRAASTPSRTSTPKDESPSISSPRKRSSSQYPAKKKRARTASGYAPPSTYAHLPLLPDAIAQNLLVLFVGLNPGIRTATTGHAYNHPSNLFWKLMYTSGVTPRRCYAEEDRQMPELYSLGLTNIVARPTRNGSELSKAEMDDGVALLEEKARKYRPESMCVVGKSIWESIWRVRHGRNVGKLFKYGWQDEEENMGVVEGEWGGARVFVASSTSGLAATLSPAEKERIWGELGAWVKMRRAEREVAEIKEEEE
ncbi:uracil DNA glycosylase superfamily protein [Pochonia chlamydosporia 170]|uniref:Uracil DNA glycosylase superfamily protein n=1 Tax=Pochonia chlamydosporia 170 TaxID=1380566 RepID=A0A179FNR1_METCM|nr:uracil DNA glycosylase superfamily protein [Pochonia chlamydosporia 170]OAQ66918.1 uracil DNA glycosylase superfamily protein [Pochonia chlamydosporia 170]